ncbi:MAG: helix-turn-helix domain-containing protein [Alistipes sp.]|nr:helix-turn-helix domain-containing protein [Alistipes sp.]
MASDSIRKSLRSDFRKYPPVLTVKQVCEIIELRPTRVYGMIKGGQIPKIEHCGRHIRVLKADVIEFLMAHKNNS